VAGNLFWDDLGEARKLALECVQAGGSRPISPSFLSFASLPVIGIGNRLVRDNRTEITRRRGPRRPVRGVTFAANAALVLLLVFPGLAVLRLTQTIDARVVAVYMCFILLSTFLAYRNDKKKAEAGEWRTPESTLHLLEILGGWPAAFLAQRLLRHKISKAKYQVAFWAIVVIHEYVTFDFLYGWRHSKTLLAAMTS